MNRRNFLKLGALFVPALVEPRRAYSFLWAPKPYVWEPVLDARVRPHTLVVSPAFYSQMGRLIAESLERSIQDGVLARDWRNHIVIKGTVSV